MFTGVMRRGREGKISNDIKSHAPYSSLVWKSLLWPLSIVHSSGPCPLFRPVIINYTSHVFIITNAHFPTYPLPLLWSLSQLAPTSTLPQQNHSSRGVTVDILFCSPMFANVVNIELRTCLRWELSWDCFFFFFRRIL